MIFGTTGTTGTTGANATARVLTIPDRPLGLGRTADYDQVAAALATCGFALPGARSRKARDVIARIAIDCIHTAKGMHAVDRHGEPRSGWTSVSFSSEWWNRAQDDYPASVGYHTVVPAVRAMAGAGIIAELQIGEQRGPNKPVRADGKSGLQTRFLPSPDLRHVRLGETRHDVGGLVRLRDRTGAPQRLPVNRRVDRMLRFISAINDAIEASNIVLKAPGMRDNGDGTITFGSKGHTVWRDRQQLYRVFNGGFDQGGRYYGPWWQAVSSRDRAWYVLDGEATVELDFETLHPRLLRACLGAPASTGDEYRIRGYEDQRGLCKVAYNALLNSSSRSSAVGAIATRAQKLEDQTFGIERPRPDRGRVPIEACYFRLASDLVDAIKGTHPEIAHGFHCGLGLTLQHADSEIATEVMRELTTKRGIITLPVHDSFIVAARHRPALQEAMDRALASRLATLRSGAASGASSTGYKKNMLHEGGAAVAAAEGSGGTSLAIRNEPGEDGVAATLELMSSFFRPHCAAAPTRGGDPRSRNATSDDGSVRSHRINASGSRPVSADATTARSSGDPRSAEAALSEVGVPPTTVDNPEKAPNEPPESDRDGQWVVEPITAREAVGVPPSGHSASVPQTEGRSAVVRARRPAFLLRSPEEARDAAMRDLIHRRLNAPMGPRISNR